MTLSSSDKLPVSFSNAFERLRATVSAEDARTFASTTMEDVWNTLWRIEHQMAAMRSHQELARTQNFLEGIERYSNVAQILCYEAPYLLYIWVT